MAVNNTRKNAGPATGVCSSKDFSKACKSSRPARKSLIVNNNTRKKRPLGITRKFLLDVCYADEPCVGDIITVCKLCGRKAWLPGDIKHKKACVMTKIIRELDAAEEGLAV